MRTDYVAVNHIYKPELLKVVDSTPEGSAGGTPVMSPGWYIARIGDEKMRRLLLKVCRNLDRLGVSIAVIRLHPEEPQDRFYLAITKADGGLEASLEQFVLLYKQ